MRRIDSLRYMKFDGSKTVENQCGETAGQKTLAWSDFFASDDFPICIFRMPFIHFDDDIPHKHEFDELVIVTGGSARHTVQGEQHNLGRGDVFYIPKGGDHGIACPEGSNLELVNVLFDFAKLPIDWMDLFSVPGFETLFWQAKQSTRSGLSNTVRLRLEADNMAGVIGTVQSIEWELAKQMAGYRFMVTSHFARLIALLSRHASHLSVEANRWTQRLLGLTAYLEEHLHKNITLPEMAKVARMSASNLRKASHEAFLESPIHHLQRLRIERSLELLADMGKSFTDIALDVGFSDSNYYTRIFRRLKKCTPSEYRKRLAQGPIPLAFPTTGSLSTR